MPGIFPTCAAVDPGFYHKLMENGKLSYDGVGRWTARWARIGIRDLIFFPVLIAEEPHWVLVAVHPKLQLVEVYDSLSDRPRGTLGTNIIHFLQQEHLGKRGRPCHGQWDHRLASRIPKQSNGHDCGVFVIMYADYLANTAAMTFTDADMPYFRRRRTVEIERQAMLDCLTPPNTQEYAAPIYVDDQQQISSHLRPSITSATSSSSDCGATFRPTDLRSEGDNTANRTTGREPYRTPVVVVLLAVVNELVGQSIGARSDGRDDCVAAGPGEGATRPGTMRALRPEGDNTANRTTWCSATNLLSVAFERADLPPPLGP